MYDGRSRVSRASGLGQRRPGVGKQACRCAVPKLAQSESLATAYLRPVVNHHSSQFGHKRQYSKGSGENGC